MSTIRVTSAHISEKLDNHDKYTFRNTGLSYVSRYIIDQGVLAVRSYEKERTRMFHYDTLLFIDKDKACQ